VLDYNEYFWEEGIQKNGNYWWISIESAL